MVHWPPHIPRARGPGGRPFAALIKLGSACQLLACSALLISSCAALDYSPFDALASSTPALVVTAATQLRPPPATTPTQIPTCAVSAAEALNLRAGPAVSFRVTAWLSAGETLMQLAAPAAESPWVYVSTRTGARGWVNGEYCR